MTPTSSTSTGSPTTTWTTLAPGILKAAVKPPKAGSFTLEVRAKDTLGRAGAPKAVLFKVADGAAPLGRWSFSEASGAALDSAPDGGASNATLTGLVNRDDRGRRGLITHDAEGVPLETPVTDKALVYAGTDGYASTAGPVVSTGSSYTVSTWVRLDDASRNNTALGQDGTMTGGWYSAFYLATGRTPRSGSCAPRRRTRRTVTSATRSSSPSGPRSSAPGPTWPPCTTTTPR
ncbi:hypothetical protein STANM309S_02951 [Streptomyces tanashiensis]